MGGAFIKCPPPPVRAQISIMVIAVIEHVPMEVGTYDTLARGYRRHRGAALAPRPPPAGDVIYTDAPV
jgi:hypothetical protein